MWRSEWLSWCVGLLGSSGWSVGLAWLVVGFGVLEVVEFLF